MTVLDIGVVVITVLFVVRGVWVGLVKQIAFLLAMVFGLYAAGMYYNLFSQSLEAWIKTPQLRFIITYTLLFFITYVLTMLLGVGLKKVMQISFLGWFDRVMGGVLGLAKGAIIVTFLFMIFSWVFSNSNPMVQKSFFSPYLMESSKILTSLLKNKELQDQLIPKKPAISSFLADPVPILKSLGGDSK